MSKRISAIAITYEANSALKYMEDKEALESTNNERLHKYEDYQIIVVKALGVKGFVGDTFRAYSAGDIIVIEKNVPHYLFNEYKSLIRKTHPHFFKHLQDHAQSKLTDLDLKYCTFIYLNIPSKQMAGLLHVEYSTIRMNKHRLKQKFNLLKEEDLDLFIKGIA